MDVIGLPSLTEREADYVRWSLREAMHYLGRARAVLDTSGNAGVQWDLALDAIQERMQDLARLCEANGGG